MAKILIFAAVFISLYTGAFFYAGVKKFDYSAHQNAAPVSQQTHTSQHS